MKSFKFIAATLLVAICSIMCGCNCCPCNSSPCNSDCGCKGDCSVNCICEDGKCACGQCPAPSGVESIH